MLDDDYKMRRIESINRMILEVASGNFVYKIERTDQYDELEALIAVINMMAEEVKMSLMHRGYLNQTYKNISGMVFVLDMDLNIQTFNSAVTQTLLLDKHELEGKNLSDFLTTESKILLESIKAGLAEHDDYPGTIELIFRAKQTFVVPAFCSASTLLDTSKHQRRILITTIETILHRREAEEELRNVIEYNETKNIMKKSPMTGIQHEIRIPLRESDVKKIKEARDFLLQHIDNPCSLKDLARKVGINDFKLKNGFKQICGTTVFGFLYEERMQMATIMLQHMEMPIKEVSIIIGYKNLSNFTAAFKKRFGYPPSSIRKKAPSS